MYMSADCKRGRKKGAARKLSKSVEKLFDTFWRFLTFFALRENCRKVSKNFLTLFDDFWRGPFPPAPFAIRWTCTWAKTQKPQNREKRVSESRKPDFPSLQKRVFRIKKIPISLQSTTWGMAIFWLEHALFWGEGKGAFLPPKPSFPTFGAFYPCTGRTDGFANRRTKHWSTVCMLGAL